jgi:mannose-1-phosphate guanylyltransferase
MIRPPALVLTAGLGTRLRPLTSVRAKAAVPVNGETLARRAVRWLVSQGITNIVLNLHHLPATVTGSVGDGADLGARVRYSWENPVLGSAGGPRHALPLLIDRSTREPRTANRVTDLANREPRTANRDTIFIIVNGDTLTDVDLGRLLARHRDAGARVTMALIPNPRPEKYGGVLVSEEGFVTGFARAGSPLPSFHFIGVQVADELVFAALEDGVPWESVNRLYPELIADNASSVAAFVCDASFRDIGTPADYLETSLQLAAVEGNHMVSACARIDATASITRCAVWDDVTIGRGVELTECIVCDGVRLPAGAAYQRVALVRPPGAPLDELMVHPIDR